MNALERAVGLWIHRRLLDSPSAHARLLDQYRAGEAFGRRFPLTVCPHLLPEGEIRLLFSQHQAREATHEALYAARIRELGEEPRPVPEGRDYMAALWRELIACGDGLPYARLGLERPLEAVELARLFTFHVVVVRRGLEELALHRDACGDRDPTTRALLERVIADEHLHAAYTAQAVEDLGGALGRGCVRTLVELVAAVEDRVYRRVTGRFLASLADGRLVSGPGVTLLLRVLAFLLRTPDGPASGDGGLAIRGEVG